MGCSDHKCSEIVVVGGLIFKTFLHICLENRGLCSIIYVLLYTHISKTKHYLLF